MAVTFLEAGTDSTYGFHLWTQAVNEGAPYLTSVTSPVHTGPRSIKCDAAGSSIQAFVEKNGILRDAGTRLSFWVYFGTFPTVIAEMVDLRDAGNTARVIWYPDNTGKHYLNAATGHQSQAATTLLTGQWYRISLCWFITSASNFTMKLYVNGVLDLTVTQATTGNWPAFGLQNLRLGHCATVGPGNSGSAVTYFDDIYVDDVTSLTDPGDIRVTAKLPASVVTSGFANTGGTGAVGERPLNATNSKADVTGASLVQTYTLETASVGDVNLSTVTLVGEMAWVWARADTASVGAALVYDNTEGAVTLPAALGLVSIAGATTTYPGSTVGIGLRSSTTPNTVLAECGALLAYIPAGAGTAYTLALAANSYGVTLGTTEGFPRPVSLILTYRR